MKLRSDLLDRNRQSEGDVNVSETSNDDVFPAVDHAPNTNSRLSRRPAFRLKHRPLGPNHPHTAGEVSTDDVNNLEAVLPPARHPLLPEHVQLQQVQDVGDALDMMHQLDEQAPLNAPDPCNAHPYPAEPRRSERLRKPNPKFEGDQWTQ